MIRVTSRNMKDKTIVQIDGALRGEFVEELAQVMSGLESPVTIDLTNLQSMDSDGADALAKLAKGVAEVIGASGYVRLLLEKHGLALED